MVEILQSRGFDSINLYILGMIYWIFINSLLEEYVFRCFITTKSAEIFDSEMTGIIFSALMFTLHHAIALHLFGFVWWQTVLASFGLISAAIIAISGCTLSIVQYGYVGFPMQFAMWLFLVSDILFYSDFLI